METDAPIYMKVSEEFNVHGNRNRTKIIQVVIFHYISTVPVYNGWAS